MTPTDIYCPDCGKRSVLDEESDDYYDFELMVILHGTTYKCTTCYERFSITWWGKEK